MVYPSPISGRHEMSPREIASNSTLGVSLRSDVPRAEQDLIVLIPNASLQIMLRCTCRSLRTTVQFEKIIAVSPKPSWRTRGLLMAAALTGLTIEIPEQPYNSDDLIYAFESIDTSDRKQGIHPGHGSARAWLAHLDIMKYVIASHMSSAFIVEDDVDWDINIHSQMRLVSDHTREFLQAPLTDSSPFGHGWDVLWLGHCGDELAEESLAYADSTILDVEISTGWSKKYVLIEQLPHGHRAVQYVQDVGCTFGHGVTRLGARRILQFLGAGQDEAFDVALMNQCRKGNLQCITVLPELMHHYTPKERTGYISPNDETE
ncbi:hypothetical protein LTR84_006360 [Exophiala bonariae]|uniref:Glycosyltransferase family 25 protein n=1 Tax=Exophiala bonariae TaxID=1690606 RepID=A0AAV9N463_9EURO|nr:hypothetical protein LTR84_006360 [Exophiala bonariae]